MYKVQVQWVAEGELELWVIPSRRRVLPVQVLRGPSAKALTPQLLAAIEVIEGEVVAPIPA